MIVLKILAGLILLLVATIHAGPVGTVWATMVLFVWLLTGPW